MHFAHVASTLNIVVCSICWEKENWKRRQEEEVEEKRREVDRTEAMLQRQLRAQTIRRANDKLYEQTGKMKLLRSNLLYAEVIEVRVQAW